MEDFKQTPQWHMGRRGEILQLATFTRFGFSLIDVGGSSNAKAPLLHRYEFSFVAPDAMAFKTGPLWMQFKTKSRHQQWRGGSMLDAEKIPPRDEEGIDRKDWLGHLKVEQDTRIPVVLAVLSIQEGELLANTLRGLGEPRESPNPAYDLVNWPTWKFRRLATFDCRRLRHYFRHKDGSYRDAPTDVPSQLQLRQTLDWLRPQQGEFDLIMLDIAAQIEAEWHQ